MFDDRKRLLYILIFAMIFGTVIVGMLVNDNADARSEQPQAPEHKITRIVRTSDEYFGGMTDQQITRHARAICAVLRAGDSIQAAVYVERRTIPADHLGVLIDSAISVYCPDYRPAMRDFIDRHS